MLSSVVLGTHDLLSTRFSQLPGEIQVVSLAFGQQARAAGIAQSVSNKGDCYDNAVAEAFFATIKKELIHRRSSPTKAELRFEAFYNRQRRHSTLG